MEDDVRILCVDDEPELLKIAKLFLERDEVFDVDTLLSATAALGLLNTKRYDAIVADYAMPEMDGIEFLKALKAQGNTTPVIIFTGRGREEVVIEALNNGADFYLQKGGDPVAQFTELSKKIHYAVSRKRAEDALRESNKKLSILFGISRQDINRELSVLTENLRVLQRKHPDIAHEEHLKKISDAARRISGLVRFAAQYEQIGVNESVWLECHTLVDDAAEKAPLGNITVKNEIPMGMEIFADPLVIRVFINLMENAVRFGGKITTIRFTAGESGGDYRVVCEDDGVGIPAADKTKIFEQGFGMNTGLGLFLAREILSITGITIDEAGEPPEGARFEITVPKGVWRSAGMNK
jgi:signal transduction histidine kinase